MRAPNDLAVAITEPASDRTARAGQMRGVSPLVTTGEQRRSRRFGAQPHYDSDSSTAYALWVLYTRPSTTWTGAGSCREAT